MKKYKVEIPKGMKVLRELWPTENNDKVVIEFKPIKKELPKTWEELECVKGYMVDDNCNLVCCNDTYSYLNPRVIWPTKELAYASIALAKLLQLRDHYNDGWKPDWNDSNKGKFSIQIYYQEIEIQTHYGPLTRVLTFKTHDLADEFLRNFGQLIETAKILL